MKIYSIQFRYDDRKHGPNGRTIRIEATTQKVAINRATREFLSGLTRKERADANKKLNILSIRTEINKELPCGCSEKPKNRGEICPKHRPTAVSAVTVQRQPRV